MELNQIRLFVLLAEHRNFSKVAEAYHISQSAVSKQISLLEYELGGKLFERDTRQVRISERGYAFLPYAKQIIALEREARISVEAMNQSMSKQIFSVHIDDGLASGVMAHGYHPCILQAICHLNKLFPNYKIKTHVFPSNEWRAQLRFQQFDLTLMRIPISRVDEPITASLKCVPIHTIRQYLVVHSTTPCQTIEDAIRSVEILIQDQSDIVRDLVGKFILKVSPTVRIYDSNNWDDLFCDLMSSPAATIVSDCTLPMFDGLDDISILPLENMDMEECICVLGRPDVSDDVIAAFSDILRSYLSQK